MTLSDDFVPASRHPGENTHAHCLPRQLSHPISRFHCAAVDRELRMIELKKRNQRTLCTGRTDASRKAVHP
jgi:hypothetical protein